jgi:hypothetical protein
MRHRVLGKADRVKLQQCTGGTLVPAAAESTSEATSENKAATSGSGCKYIVGGGAGALERLLDASAPLLIITSVAAIKRAAVFSRVVGVFTRRARHAFLERPLAASRAAFWYLRKQLD